MADSEGGTAWTGGPRPIAYKARR